MTKIILQVYLEVVHAVAVDEGWLEERQACSYRS